LRGADFAARARQVPGDSAAVQVWQPLVQALLQQTPSTQWLLPHSASQLQVSPSPSAGPFAPQVLPIEASPPSMVPPSGWGITFFMSGPSELASLWVGGPPPPPPHPAKVPANTSAAAIER
jgi:hypothetical protein